MKIIHTPLFKNKKNLSFFFFIKVKSQFRGDQNECRDRISHICGRRPGNGIVRNFHVNATRLQIFKVSLLLIFGGKRKIRFPLYFLVICVNKINTALPVLLQVNRFIAGSVLQFLRRSLASLSNKLTHKQLTRLLLLKHANYQIYELRTVSV